MISNPFAGTKSSQLEALKREYEDVEQAPVLDALSEFVHKQFRTARDHRRKIGVDEQIGYARHAMRLEYTAEELAKFGEDATVYLGLTNIKVRAARSWMNDILANAEDQPWTIKPTPVPELPSNVMDVVLDRLEQHVREHGFDVQLPEEAAETKALAKRFANKLAIEGAERLEDTLRDQLLEGGWREAFDEFAADLMQYPAAILKGPYLQREPSFRWVGDELKVVERLTRKIERVDPSDAFPSPNATSPQNGAYFIQRVRCTSDDLLNYATTPGFSEAAVRTALLDNPRGYSREAFGDSEADHANNIDTDACPPDEQYEVLVYYGKLAVELLQEHGVGQDMDPQKRCEAEVWVCGEHVLKAVLNPHPLGRRPFYATSFERSAGAFWGQSLPTILRDVQRVANASARNIVKNAAFASGPVGEYDVDRMDDEEDPTDVRPYRLYGVESKPGVSQPAIRWQNIPTVVTDLMNLYQWASKLADDYSGIPAYVVGNPQVAGAGRTLGGLSMLMGNAAKGIKAVIGNVDRYVIEPLITALYELEMLFGDDPTLKLDVKVIARGSSGILQRELSQARSVEVMQTLVPFATGEKPIVKPDALKIVLRDMLRSLGYTADELVEDPDDTARLRTALDQMGLVDTPTVPSVGVPAAPVSTSTPRTPPPKLDRRSRAPVSPDTRERLPLAA